MVKLPKEVADSIHYYQVKGREKSLFNVPTIASSSAKNKRYKAIHDYIHSSEENFKKYFKALVDGYEVEQTKEEQLLSYYNSLGKPAEIKKTLKILGIQIFGINMEVNK
jgi:biotin synthase-like enzyme